MEARRPGNYGPRIWDDDYLQSQASIYVGEEYSKQAAKLKENVRMMLNDKDMRALDQLELVDNLQRLGIHYHFEAEIRRILENIYNLSNCEDHLYGVALQFRLLRQEGYQVPQEVFSIFMNEKGQFKEILCMNTIKGVFSLYEASYLSIEDESIMEMAQKFSIHNIKKYLKQKMDDHDENNILVKQVSHALEMPLHWKLQRLEARWFIDNVYEQSECFNPILLQLAKLDFNMLQAIYLDELKHLSRWHENINLVEMMGFTRDRLVEIFFWNVGFAFEPNFWFCRKWIVNLGEFITVIDDIYELHGTLEELVLFTDMVDRLILTISLSRSAHSIRSKYISLKIMKKINWSRKLIYMVMKCKELCKTYLVDAKWYYEYDNKYTPSFKEFLNHGWVSIGGRFVIKLFYICTMNLIKKDDLELLEQNPPLIQWPSLIGRLEDDLGTSQDEIKRGDAPKSIQFYMMETKSSEENARDYMKELIGQTWKKMNKEVLMDNTTSFSKDFVRIAMNFARGAQCMYQYGDWYGKPDGETKRSILFLFDKF
ncbi:hypothetical protein R3W88_008318 [Solanum pinnatisectum]|uniref:Uncharacterized protein n=1 Tax=Solanum pinnatisectum TaxID=50273 RepID=A0AAV9M9J2_9SOLN|nr:hypothetical protein R3W88_008318 [Solanum pinnatisectum]